MQQEEDENKENKERRERRKKERKKGEDFKLSFKKESLTKKTDSNGLRPLVKPGGTAHRKNCRMAGINATHQKC